MVCMTLPWRGVDSNHQFRESRHRCPHVDFSVASGAAVAERGGEPLYRSSGDARAGEPACSPPRRNLTATVLILQGF